jgi:2'-5' RNA ligase
MNRPHPLDKERLFVALELPASWTAALGELQEKMRTALAAELGAAMPRLRWTRPEGIHLTLKFLGETPLLKSAAIDRALREASQSSEAFTLTLGRPGSFADRRGPRVLFVDVEGDIEPLRSLARQVDIALTDAEFARERRALAPHLTLARLPEEIGTPQRERIAAVAAGVRTPRPGPQQFRTFSLMRSHLERGGARYERVRSYKLL